MARTISTIIALLAIIWLFMQFWESPPEAFFRKKTTVTTTSKANTYMRSTETRQFGVSGELEYLLTTTEMSQFKRPERVDIKAPHLITYQPNQPPWTLTADNGQVTKGGDEMLLTGHVYAWQPTAKGGRRELQTPKLLIFPEKKYAETDKPVTLRQPGSLTTGVGMKADLIKQQYRLQSQVRSKYDAPSDIQ